MDRKENRKIRLRLLKKVILKIAMNEEGNEKNGIFNERANHQ